MTPDIPARRPRVASCGPGSKPEAAARVCLTSGLGVLIGLPSEPYRRRADFGLLFSLYLTEDPS